MRTTWEKLLHHVRTIYGNDISKKIFNKKTVIIPKLEHTQDVIYEHQLTTKRRYHSYQRLAEARKFQKGVFEVQVVEGEPTIAAKAKISLAILNNEMV